MYKKRNKVINKARDFRIESICSELIKFNPDTLFITSKKFVLRPDKKLGEEIKGLPIVVTTTPVEELFIPSSYSLTKNNELSTWCDKEDGLVKLVNSNVKFIDGEINGRKISNLYLDVLEEQEIKKQKRYKRF